MSDAYDYLKAAGASIRLLNAVAGLHTKESKIKTLGELVHYIRKYGYQSLRCCTRGMGKKSITELECIMNEYIGTSSPHVPVIMVIDLQVNKEMTLESLDVKSGKAVIHSDQYGYCSQTISNLKFVNNHLK
jgi:hypothetical protein